VLLKAYFPLNVHADHATYEVQFGTLDRPTHENTSWDAAKFEVCAHKWADMSDGSYGVSLLNDCKYGYSADGNVLSLTLLKAPTSPDPVADRGEHEFTYVLYPHAGDWRVGGTVAHAYALNRPAVACVLDAQTGKLPEVYSAMSCSADALVVDTLKAAYDGSGDAIARLYESANTQGVARLVPGFAFSEAVLCDTEENEVAPLEVKDGCVVVPYGHYELLTIRFKK
jgi:alpha-mannosidase